MNSSLSFDLIGNAFNKLSACETCRSVYSVYTDISYLLLFYLLKQNTVYCGIEKRCNR